MTKKLQRSNDRVLGGVCAGFAEYMDFDPVAVRLGYAALTLFTAFAAAEKQRQDTLDAKYKRPEEKELVAMDAELLKTAMNGLRDSAGSAPTSGSPENESRGKLFTEMMKRMEHARSLAEQGIQLSGESTKALVDAVKAYNIDACASSFDELFAVLKNWSEQG